MADYFIYITELDADNINSVNRGSVLHGYTNNTYNLTQKTFIQLRGGSNIDPVTTPQIWEDNIPRINDATITEINRVQRLLLIDKATLYELTFFDVSFRVVKQSDIDYTKAQIAQHEANLEFLNNYIP